MATGSALVAHFQALAEYNARANRILYAACAELTDAARRQIRPAFFKSIHGTLNHILLGDRIWLARLAGETVPSTGLDAILYEHFAGLRAARDDQDSAIVSFTADLSDAALSRTIEYINNQGRLHADPVDLLVAHMFNHQTHHRGQVHDMLSQTNVSPPSLDMHRLLHPNPVD